MKKSKWAKKPAKLFYQLDGIRRNYLGLVGPKGPDGLMDMNQCRLIIGGKSYYEFYVDGYVITVQSAGITRERY